MASIDLGKLIQESIMKAGQKQTEVVQESSNHDYPAGFGPSKPFVPEEPVSFGKPSDPKLPEFKVPTALSTKAKALAEELGISVKEAYEHLKQHPGKAAAAVGVGAGALAAGVGLHKYLKAKKQAGR